jgi:hypothetical protein
MSDEFIEPTPESRRNLLLLFFAALVVAGALKFWLMPALFSHIAGLPRCEQLRWLRGVLLVAIATPAIFGMWAIPQSLRLFKLNQSPLPGTWVWRRTPVRRGRAVRLRAAYVLVVGLAALAFPILGLHLLQSTPFAAPSVVCSE